MTKEAGNEPAADLEQGYEPPQVECVIDADELSREVHYAGGVVVSPP